MTAQNKAIIASYARTFLATVIALYSAGNHDLKTLAIAGAAATIAPILRALNPKDSAFGAGAELITFEFDKLAKPTVKKIK